MNIKKAVLADAKKQLAEFRASLAWLETAIPFNVTLTFETYPPALFDILKECDLPDRIETRTSLQVLCANLVQSKRPPVTVSLNVNDWSKTSHQPIGKSVIKIINSLNDHGFLILKKGYRMKTASKLSRVWATEKLLQYLPRQSNLVIHRPIQLVELRDEKGKLKDYKDTAETYRIRRILKLVNEVNGEADIRYLKNKLSAHLYAIFRKRFTLYGRLHTRGISHYQQFSEDERDEITINGDPVIELDFSGLHPHLLYAKEGIQFLGDPYSIVDNRPEARRFLKIILLALLNSNDEVTAVKAANYFLYRNPTDWWILKELKVPKAKVLIEAFKTAHAPIAHYFCTGKDTGLRIMNLDSKIALDIINHFAKQGIPILSVHDSFIMQRPYKAELKHVMQTAYRKHTGGFRCPIK